MSLLFSLIFGNPRKVLALLGVALVALAWVTIRVQQATLHRLEEQLAHARQDADNARKQAALHATATNEADHSQRVNRVSHEAVAVSQQEVANAVDAHAQYVAWTSGVMRVRNADAAERTA